MRSKAAIHVEHGKPLEVDEIEIPDPRADQVHVKLLLQRRLSLAAPPDAQPADSDTISPRARRHRNE